MLFLEANDALSFFEYNIMPLSNTTIGLHLAYCEVSLVAETNLVYPVLARLDSHFPDRARLVQHDLLITLVDARVASEG